MHLLLISIEIFLHRSPWIEHPMHPNIPGKDVDLRDFCGPPAHHGRREHDRFIACDERDVHRDERSPSSRFRMGSARDP
jgi:hypothetical protein